MTQDPALVGSSSSLGPETTRATLQALEKFLLESDFETGGKTSDLRYTPVEDDIVYRIGP